MTTRRSFFRVISAALYALVVYPWKRAGAQPIDGEGHADSSEVSAPTQSDSLAEPEPKAKKVAIPLERVEALQKTGGSAILTIADHKLLFIRDTEKSVRVFSSACTHQQVTLKYHKKSGEIRCPAHGSRFDMDGAVKKGPAGKPLTVFETVLKEDTILLTLPAG